MPGTRAYRKVAGARAGKPENDDVHSHEWSRRPDVKARIQELMAENAQRAQMTREELLAFYAEVIRTPADSVPSNSRIIQAYEETEHGHKIRLVDKAAAGAALAKMCGWDEPTKIVVTTDPLLVYLRELRATPIGGTVLWFEHQRLNLENGATGEESRCQGAQGGKMSAQAPAELTREGALQLLAQIVKDPQIALKDRVDAIRIHSSWLGYQLTEGQILSVIAMLANGGTES
jgi:hypothetical protein